MKTQADKGGPWELYDLAADRAETQNLAGTFPSLVREFTVQWQQWADHCGVKL